MVTKRDLNRVLASNKKEKEGIHRGIAYCKAQIKKNPKGWEAKEYKQVIKGDQSRLKEIDKHNKALKKLGRKVAKG